jgi:hypothetical protein
MSISKSPMRPWRMNLSGGESRRQNLNAKLMLLEDISCKIWPKSRHYAWNSTNSIIVTFHQTSNFCSSHPRPAMTSSRNRCLRNQVTLRLSLGKQLWTSSWRRSLQKSCFRVKKLLNMINLTILTTARWRLILSKIKIRDPLIKSLKGITVRRAQRRIRRRCDVYNYRLSDEVSS